MSPHSSGVAESVTAVSILLKSRSSRILRHRSVSPAEPHPPATLAARDKVLVLAQRYKLKIKNQLLDPAEDLFHFNGRILDSLKRCPQTLHGRLQSKVAFTGRGGLSEFHHAGGEQTLPLNLKAPSIGPARRLSRPVNEPELIGKAHIRARKPWSSHATHRHQ